MRMARLAATATDPTTSVQCGPGSLMDRSELAELHYITAIDNLPSMMQYGLLSHRRAANLSHRSVALQVIQGLRSKKQVPGGQHLHEYVNLYINARNAMLSRVLVDASVHDICVVRVSTDVLDLPGVAIADQNAASDYVRFTNAPSGLARIDRATVFAQYWTHPGDQIAEWRHKSAMCAEVLVPDVVDPGYLGGVYVGSQKAQQRVAALGSTLLATLDPQKFFL